jgi:acetylornithine deacetylase
MPINLDQEYLTNVLSDLVRIDSVNPDLNSEGVGEARIAKFLAETLRQNGMKVRTYELAPQRYNVVGIRKGSGGGKSLMWNAHLDTVGSNGMEHPFQPEIQGGRLYGRGSQDMKGGLAAMVAAARALNEAGIELSGDLMITGVADEEYASLGALDLLRHHKTDAAIVAEPTELRLCLAHRGFAIYEIDTLGRAAHGSRFREGIDAITQMGRVLVRLEQLGQNLIERNPHPLVGPPSLHASLIQGGTEASTYPAHCHLVLERRTNPGETDERVNAEIHAILNELATDDPKFEARMQVTLARPPFEIDRQAEIVQTVASAFQHTLSSPPIIGGASFWTDAALFSQAGIPSVLLGPTGTGLHSAVEWVDLQSCFDLGRILIQTALDYCSIQKS